MVDVAHTEIESRQFAIVDKKEGASDRPKYFASDNAPTDEVVAE